MSVALDRDRSIVSQVAAKVAADLYAKLGYTTWESDAFAQIQADVFEQIIALSEISVPAGAPQQPAPNPIAQVGQHFPGATNVSGTPQAVPQQLPPQGYAPQQPTYDNSPQGFSNDGMPEVLKQLVGPQGPVPLPDWLPTQYAKSKCIPGEAVYDNRKDLAIFGGSRSGNLPWFRGKDSKEGIWPPKGAN